MYIIWSSILIILYDALGKSHCNPDANQTETGLFALCVILFSVGCGIILTCAMIGFVRYKIIRCCCIHIQNIWLGLGDCNNKLSPTEIALDKNIELIACGWDFTVAIVSNSKVLCK